MGRSRPREPERPPEFDPSSTIRVTMPRPGAGAAAGEESVPLRVEVLGGPMDGLRSRVSARSLHMGRTTENDLSLVLDASVSGRHARLVREGGHYWLEDMGSRNGTYIGDRRIEGRILVSSGTTFQVGRTRLEFLSP